MNRRIPSRIAVTFGAALILALTGFGAAAQTEDSAPSPDSSRPTPDASRLTSFEIPPQPLSDALILFGDQSGQGVMADSVATETLSSPGYTGEALPEIALRQLLEGTGLTYRQDGDVFVIVSPASSSIAGQNTIGQRRPGIEEIIVTGQKREERIQDVPIAISAFTQEDLTVSQIAGGPDLHLQVPNMTFTKTNFTGYSIQIRGIGTQAISATTDPAVAVALNQTTFIRNRFFEQEFYDLERVEVLRGPQGTLFGRNATAGVVNLISAKPKFQQESLLSYDKGNYDSSRWEFMVNTPLVDDRVALRIAGAGTKRDGYAINELTDTPIDGRDLWSTRVSLRFAPNDNLDMNLIWEHFEEDDDRLRSGKQLCSKHVVEEVNGVPVTSFGQPLIDRNISADWVAVQPRLSQGCERESLYSEDSFQTPNGAMVPYYVPAAVLGVPITFFDPYASQVQSHDLRVIESTVEPEYYARSDIGQLQIDYQLTDGLLLESETAYSTDEIFSKQDFNRFNTVPGAFQAFNDNGNPTNAFRDGVIDEDGVFCDPQIGCADRMVLVDVSSAESSQFSQELRLSSQFDGPFNFSLGANYLRYDTEDKYYVFANTLSLGALVDTSISSSAQSPSNPYVPGVSDNRECLLHDLQPRDPAEITLGFGCIYVEQNPIGSLEDTGHNYFLSKNPYDLDSYGIFGETYWNITDELKLTAGLRWSVDKKTAPLIPSQLVVGGSFGYPTLTTIEQEWREPTGRLVLDWQPVLDFTDETLVYGSIARGYKAGGTNPPPFAGAGTLSSATRPQTFDAEFVNAFELGTKNTLADGNVTLNLTAFYYDYTDYQISEIVDRSAFNQNYDAEVWGFEIETDWWARENLRLGFKGGYQKTRIADGEQAVDLMDRTAGGHRVVVTDVPNPDFDDSKDPRPVSEYEDFQPGVNPPDDQPFFAYTNWTIVRPFPAIPSSCILPAVLYGHGGQIYDVGAGGGAFDGGCLRAYFEGRDPITFNPYEPNPPATIPGQQGANVYSDLRPNYPGFDPSMPELNNGEGFFKDLGGNEFPNAPNYTATVTADYIIPLGGDWTMTAHTDIYWQDESWWRIFNDHEYNRLDDYFTMNLAAIFVNDVDGWNIMAYVKNVTDETAITGAFLGSDDTGLTTNVFLTEPRLYGLRATKRWGDGGGPAAWLGGAGAALLGKEPGEPTPFSLTLGGQMLRPKRAKNDIPAPEFISAFDPKISPLNVVEDDLDWGDGREITLTYAPENGWHFSLGARFGKSNRDKRDALNGESHQGCILLASYSNPPCSQVNDLGHIVYGYESRTDYSLTDLTEVEEHSIVDFMVGRDVGLGGLIEASLSAGLRYARFESQTNIAFSGQPDWQLPENCIFGEIFPACGKYSQPSQHHEYAGALDAKREFEGIGPVVGWEASTRLVDDARGGHLDLDWSLSGGVLFGKQTAKVRGSYEGAYFDGPLPRNSQEALDEEPVSSYEVTFDLERDDDGIEAVPTLGAGLGLSYRIDGFSIGAGYHWERYYSVIDGGIEERKMYDRTLDGPYLKITFGGGS